MNENWKQELEDSAQSLEMCKPYLFTLKNKITNKKDALRLYKAGIDWALENNYPGIDFLRKHFSIKELECMGIYIDREFHGETINDHIFQVFHNCTGNIKVEMNMQKVIIPTLYLASGSNMKVEIKGTDISVFLFDNSKIDAIGKYKLRKVNLERYNSDGYMEKQSY